MKGRKIKSDSVEGPAGEQQTLSGRVLRSAVCLWRREVCDKTLPLFTIPRTHQQVVILK